VNDLLEALLGSEFDIFAENSSPPSPTSPQMGDSDGQVENDPLKPPIKAFDPEHQDVARVILNPVQGPGGKHMRRFLVALDGTTACPRCGERGYIPHHLSLLFWKYWDREQVAALADSMRSDERLAWLAHRLVRLEDTGGNVRFLRECNGQWVDEGI
jgi:hypothetical protein